MGYSVACVCIVIFLLAAEIGDIELQRTFIVACLHRGYILCHRKLYTVFSWVYLLSPSFPSVVNTSLIEMTTYLSTCMFPHPATLYFPLSLAAWDLIVSFDVPRYSI